MYWWQKAEQSSEGLIVSGIWRDFVTCTTSCQAMVVFPHWHKFISMKVFCWMVSKEERSSWWWPLFSEKNPMPQAMASSSWWRTLVRILISFAPLVFFLEQVDLWLFSVTRHNKSVQWVLLTFSLWPITASKLSQGHAPASLTQSPSLTAQREKKTAEIEEGGSVSPRPVLIQARRLMTISKDFLLVCPPKPQFNWTKLNCTEFT